MTDLRLMSPQVEATPNPKLQSMLINIAMQLANLLFHENTELVGESLRALGIRFNDKIKRSAI
jgi:hypothetical protein